MIDINEVNGNLISVVLPIYNGAKTIRRAVESVLAQTYKNFEFIIINDGSTDETPEILTSLHDERIRILHQENRGLVASLNRGITEAAGKHIARMDADDFAMPKRLEKQVEFMESHPTVGVLGTAVKIVYSDGTERIRRRPLDTASIRKNIVKICPFCHSSVMIRKEVFDKVGPYDSSKDGSKKLLVEDYDLWVRVLAAGYDMANLPDVLMVYYKEPASILRSRSLSMRLKQQVLSRIEIIKRLNLGYSAYLNIPPVVMLSILNHFGVRLDRIFNLLSDDSER
jgi:glycosyltransferase involved in cell wall biosynthesis